MLLCYCVVAEHIIVHNSLFYLTFLLTLTKKCCLFKVGVYERNRPRKKLKVNKKGKSKGRQWVLKKKEQMRKKGNEVPPDSKYTARKRKAYF